MAAKGVDDEMVSKYVGHADSKITKKIYTHLTDQAANDIANYIDEALGGAKA